MPKNKVDYEYIRLLNHVLQNGEIRSNRTTTKALTVFGYQYRLDLKDGFPLLTTKQVNFSKIITELLWFLRGDTNIEYLHKYNCHIWDEWADGDGELRNCYGKEWRRWETPDHSKPIFQNNHGAGAQHGFELKEVDQIQNLVNTIKTDPFSRRLMLNAWNPGEEKEASLPWCHSQVQFHVSCDMRLSCHLTQRSGDCFLGIPFNIASYALLTHMLAQVCGLKGVGTLVHSIGDLHIYANHLEQVHLQLSREPFPLPTLWLDPSVKNIDDFKHEHIRLDNYQHHPAIKAPISV